jgi:sulfate adenylyltransferase
MSAPAPEITSQESFSVDRDLVDLFVDRSQVDDLRKFGNELRSVRLSERAICDLEMLAVGGFSPVNTFLGAADFHGVVETMRLADGTIFPIPVALPVDRDANIKEGNAIALRDQRSDLLAVMEVVEVYSWDKHKFQNAVLGTEDARHPLVAESNGWGELNVSGKLSVIDLPKRYDFPDIRLTPHQLRHRLRDFDQEAIVAFQTRNPPHRAHEEMIRRTVEQFDGVVLVHPAVGMTKPGDVDHHVRVKAYRALIENYFPDRRVMLSLLPLAMRMAGPREALWHAVIRKNYGATHMIVGRDHASPGSDSLSRPFYAPYAAQELFAEYSDEIGVELVPFQEMVYLPRKRAYSTVAEVSPACDAIALSGSEIRNEYLQHGRPIPEWYMRPEVSDILSEAYIPQHRRGVCIWFTGLSCSGKSTTAEMLTSLLSANGRSVTLLDGDIVRTNLSAGLGFDKVGRDANVRRIGFVAHEIVKHGGVAVCAAISPYRETREAVRQMFPEGSFIEVFVDTPLEVCEQRDSKGMYAKARRGEIENFTGISDAYEPPSSCEIRLDTVTKGVEENTNFIFGELRRLGLIKSA